MTLPVGRQGEIRKNIAAAIRALSGWPPEVPVETLALAQDAFRREHRTMVGVTLTDDTWQHIDDGISDYLDRAAEIDVSIVVYSTSESGGDSTTGVLDSDDGMIDGLVGLILGSSVGGYGSGLRSVNVGIAGETGGVYLRAVKTQLMADQKRAEGSGGALAKIIMMRTTTLPL